MSVHLVAEQGTHKHITRRCELHDHEEQASFFECTIEGDDIAVRRDTVVIINLLSLLGDLVGGQPCSQDTLDGDEWRPILSEIASTVGDAVCAVAELSFELEAAIVDDDASEVGDEIRFARSFDGHGDGLRKRMRRSEDVARREGEEEWERQTWKGTQRGRRLETTELVEEREGRKRRKRVKNEDKQKQTEQAEIGAGLSEFVWAITGSAAIIVSGVVSGSPLAWLPSLQHIYAMATYKDNRSFVLRGIDDVVYEERPVPNGPFVSPPSPTSSTLI